MNEFNEVLQVCTCGVCGVAFGITKSFYDTIFNSGQNFTCVNGHIVHYGKTTKERAEELSNLKTENTRLLARIDQLEAELAELKSKK